MSKSEQDDQLAISVLTVTGAIAGALMRVERANFVPGTGGRRETTAEHSFHLALVACLILPLFPELDDACVLRYVIVHDIAEARAGDVSVYAPEEERIQKAEAEYRALAYMRGLGSRIAESIISLAQRYTEQASRESQFVYALDKIVPYFLVLAGSGHHANPTPEQYLATERRARAQIESAFPDLLPLFEHAAEGVRSRVGA